MSYIVRTPGRHEETNEIQVDEYDWLSFIRTDSLGDHLDRLYARIADLEAEIEKLKKP